MPLISTSCCERMCLNTASTMGSETRIERLRPFMLEKPSITIRRSMRSSTNDSGIPRSPKFWGTVGRNEDRTGANVAIGITTIGRGSLRVYCTFGPGKASSLSVARLRTGLILLAFAGVLGAEDQAGVLFRAAQRAQRSGDSLQAYQLYTRAAALDPSNAQYTLHRNALRDWAALSAQISLGGDEA